jgi:hypothetical protein
MLADSPAYLFFKCWQRLRWVRNRRLWLEGGKQLRGFALGECPADLQRRPASDASQQVSSKQQLSENT